MGPLDPRLVHRVRAVRVMLVVADAVLGVLAALLVLAQAVLLARVAARGFEGAGLGELTLPLVLLVAVAACRGAAAWGFEVGRAPGRGERALRAAPRPRRETAPRPSCGSRRRRERGACDARRRRSRRARDDVRPLSPAGRARDGRPGRRARARRLDRPRLGRDHAPDAPARARLHVAGRPLHGAADAATLAGAPAPVDALSGRRSRAADASRLQSGRSPGRADRAGQRRVPARRRWARSGSPSSPGRCSSSRPRSGSRSWP